MTASVIPRNCPVCSADQAELHWSKDALRVVKCRHCSMVYTNPVPSTYASGEYYDRDAADYYLSPQKLNSDYSPVRFARELKLVSEFSPTGSILDVGCSTGGFLFQLQNQFPGVYQVMGTDASGPALDYAERQGISVVRDDFLRHDFGAQQFDAVTLWAVLEHLFDPAAFLEKAHSLLTPQGRCFALVPNLGSLAQRLLGAKYRYVYPQHLNYFSSCSLRRLAGRFFKVIAVAFTHFNPVIIWQDWKSGGREPSNQARGALLQKTTGLKTNPRLKLLHPIYAAAEKGLSLGHLADNVAVILEKK